ncbi:RagB/SusD family nutrient uptake outer membrane protein [termite gut metagenome]|uniref:RagB/SusD family nutrient uptake outer membrane protein n=1 Tax=termite gut metagenome TaxID=433724 RepID=A0A5J4S7S5_9ZZZZ
MNNIYNKIPGFLFFVWIISSCDSFLDTQPTDKYTQDNYWNTEEKAVAALNGVYASLLDGSLYGNSQPLNYENLTPNAYGASENIINQSLHNANTGLFNSVWSAAYKGIGRANNFLANIDNVSINESLKQRYIAEAKFLRAVFYFPLWNLFGGAPLILEATNDVTQATLPRNSAEELKTQILKDLDEAVGNLPLSYSGADIGRVTKGAVLAFKSRILLYDGDWEGAATTARAVIDLNKYHLFPDYRELFYLENENNDEVIFDVQFKYPEFTHAYDMTLDQYNNVAPLRDLVDDYYDIDGKPITESSKYDPNNPYENRDPRLKKTIITKDSYFRGTLVDDVRYMRTGYGQKKYTVYKDDIPAETIAAGNSELNYMLLRYGDILLMYAEAKNEVSGPDNTIYEALDLIRDRAGIPRIGRSLTKEQLRQEIRHERRIELAGEGFYYFDIRRWRIAEDVLKGDIYNDKGARIDGRNFNKDRDYLWPIPSIAIQENTNLIQNSGYGN